MKFKRKHPECVEILGVAREVVLRFVEEGQDFKDDITTSDFLSALQGSISQLYFEMMSDPEQRYRFRHVTVDIMRKRVHDIVDVLLEEAGIA